MSDPRYARCCRCAEPRGQSPGEWADGICSSCQADLVPPEMSPARKAIIEFLAAAHMAGRTDD